MSRRMWKAVETKAEKTRVAKTKGERSKGRSRKEEKRKSRKTKEKKIEEEMMIKVKRIAEEWKIWNEKEKVVKSETEAKKLVSEEFHR